MFDSDEELYFSYFLEELLSIGVILSYEHNPEPFVLTKGFNKEYQKILKKSTKILTQKVIGKKIYTTDFKIVWNPDKDISIIAQDIDDTILKITCPFLYKKEKQSDDTIQLISYVETKGIFDRNNMTRLFQQNKAWLFDKYQIYINLIKLPSFFEETFTPQKYLFTKIKKDTRRLKYTPKTIKEFFNLK
jgi:hypothetical protein